MRFELCTLCTLRFKPRKLNETLYSNQITIYTKLESEERKEDLETELSSFRLIYLIK